MCFTSRGNFAIRANIIRFQVSKYNLPQSKNRGNTEEIQRIQNTNTNAFFNAEKKQRSQRSAERKTRNTIEILREGSMSL